MENRKDLKTEKILKIKQGLLLKSVEGGFIVIAVGKMVKEFNGAITLNSSGAFLWQQLEKGVTKSQLIERLCNEYEVDNDKAENDVNAFVEKLTKANLIEG